ncbi:Z1 domain-containing protein [Hoeflea ulvae]|uniref:DEAD/DEAH box helicase family protein n=1 Tax=Hoeflea ulvae TaxID=2983764 RepID=A0ABT3YBJ5_9HYPH|nr:Z1 domain-containing protein [Hoeflea ulvae]MCY0093164.1 DEAD/DEAH box helicase family protein [Hoeflea ulvae]
MDWASIVGDIGGQQYQSRLEKLNANKIDTRSIEDTVEKTITNLQTSGCRSFVVFGEPQSGKTEMMIALNARLLDEGAGVIVNLLTDSIDLLDQSLSRFRASGLSPSPKQFSELPHNAKDLGKKKWVIFSKKNARDLEKLITLLRARNDIIVIDDEADFASPNAKINNNDKTTINRLIHDLIGKEGQYIGVTATPARLNLNNTFENDSELWVDFLPHPYYVGQDYFFPTDGLVSYRLHTFNAHEGSERSELKNAILHFLCGVAEQHQRGHNQNFTMLVHASGKKDEHENDIGVIEKTINTLADPNHSGFKNIVAKLEKIAPEYSATHPKLIVEFVLRNIDRHAIIEINSKGRSGKVSDIAKPTSLFSFGAGGNIISRGVTFDNLLSMYFTRAVKGKFSQDTYIQRARMFGSREDYKEYFQLWIPDELLANWSKCFAFHKLAIQAMRSKAGAPVWLADHKTTPTAANSIDKSTVDFEGGEMSFGLFAFDKSKYDDLMGRNGRTNEVMLDAIRAEMGESEFPDYLFDYLRHDLKAARASISFHPSSGFGVAAKTYTNEEIESIRRKKGIFATNEFGRSEIPTAKHHLKIFTNNRGKARLFYKINGNAVKFVQNKK